VTIETLSVKPVQQPTNKVRLCSKHLSAANKRLFLPAKCQVVKTLAFHCYCDVCSVAGGHSAVCRTSWVCLQHHATVVTSNGVTVCGSQFPPTVSMHCQHQHSAIPKTMQQYEIPTIPVLMISRLLLSKSSIIAAFVHSNSRHFFDIPSGLPT